MSGMEQRYQILGATDDELGNFVCVDCIPRLSPGEGGVWETCVSDLRGAVERRKREEPDDPGEMAWSALWADEDDEIIADIEEALGGCVSCGRLPTQVAPSPVPTGAA